MDTVRTKQNQIIATIWFTLGLTVVVSAFIALLGSGKFVAPALFMLSVILFMTGAQRTARFAIESARFNKRIQIAGLATAIVSSLSIVATYAM